MGNEPLLDIEQIIKLSPQGQSGVFYCKAADGNYYWVKGHNVGRQDQIYEWLCGHLALAFGLPIAPFCIANIDESLVAYSPEKLQRVGYGPVFASKHAASGACWLGIQGHSSLIPEDIRLKILLFDYWIHNTDREPFNPNLLWNAHTSEVVVIDHNLAFDDEVNEKTLVGAHIFSDVNRLPFRDLTVRCELMVQMDAALEAMKLQIDNIPTEWEWADLEQTRPTRLDFPALLSILNRYKEDNEAFWSVL